MIIPGKLINFLTFPGVIVHEIAHKFFCDIFNIPVYKVCYFSSDGSGGYVIHKTESNLKKVFLISIGPLIVNSLLCILLTMPFILPFKLGLVKYPIVINILFWIGISSGVHAFPSKQDMKTFYVKVKELKPNFFLLGFAFVIMVIFRIANLLRFIWFDFIYAIMLMHVGIKILGL